VNLFVQYRINVWNRHLFDALEKKDGSEVWTQALIFVPLTVANVSLAVAAIYTRMTTQQTWRRWLNARVLDRWISGGRYYQLSFVSGDHANPEYRVADDLRVSVDAPVDFAIGLLHALLSAVTFITVLWFIGGALAIPGTSITIPGLLVVAAVIYAVGRQRCDDRNRAQLRPGLREQEPGGGGVSIRADPPARERREHRAARRRDRGTIRTRCVVSERP
jgi:putative ATP-binding cassette transporter